MDFYYPFKNLDVYIDEPACPGGKAQQTTYPLDSVFKSSSEFFVFTGVVSMLFVLVTLAYYILFEDQDKEAGSTDIGIFSFPVVVSLI